MPNTPNASYFLSVLGVADQFRLLGTDKPTSVLTSTHVIDVLSPHELHLHERQDQPPAPIGVEYIRRGTQWFQRTRPGDGGWYRERRVRAARTANVSDTRVIGSCNAADMEYEFFGLPSPLVWAEANEVAYIPHISNDVSVASFRQLILYRVLGVGLPVRRLFANAGYILAQAPL